MERTRNAAGRERQCPIGMRELKLAQKHTWMQQVLCQILMASATSAQAGKAMWVSAFPVNAALSLMDGPTDVAVYVKHLHVTCLTTAVRHARMDNDHMFAAHDCNDCGNTVVQSRHEQESVRNSL